jgi:hypothetical protein
MRELKLGGSLCNLLEGRRNFNEKLLSELMTGRSGVSLSLGQDTTESDWTWAEEEGGNQERFPGPIGDVCDRCDRRGHGRAGGLDGNLSNRDIINAVVAMDGMGGEGVKAGRVEEWKNSRIYFWKRRRRIIQRDGEGRCVCPKQCQSPKVSGTWKKRSGKECLFFLAGGWFLAMTRGPDEGGRFGRSSEWMGRKEQG